MPDLEALYQEALATVEQHHALDQDYQAIGTRQMDLLTTLFQSPEPIDSQVEELVRTFLRQSDMDACLYFRLGYEAARKKSRVP